MQRRRAHVRDRPEDVATGRLLLAVTAAVSLAAGSTLFTLSRVTSSTRASGPSRAVPRSDFATSELAPSSEANAGTGIRSIADRIAAIDTADRRQGIHPTSTSRQSTAAQTASAKHGAGSDDADETEVQSQSRAVTTPSNHKHHDRPASSPRHVFLGTDSHRNEDLLPTIDPTPSISSTAADVAVNRDQTMQGRLSILLPGPGSGQGRKTGENMCVIPVMGSHARCVEIIYKQMISYHHHD